MEDIPCIIVSSSKALETCVTSRGVLGSTQISGRHLTLNFYEGWRITLGEVTGEVKIESEIVIQCGILCDPMAHKVRGGRRENEHSKCQQLLNLMQGVWSLLH